jgi:DNA-binding transcriptional MerR regulator
MGSDIESPGLTVAQMAGATGVKAHTLRYYERAGLIRSIARNAGNQRRYSGSDIEWVRFLLRLRETGMPIAQMREYAERRAEGERATAARLEMLEHHQTRLRERIARLRRHEAGLDAKISTYRRTLSGLRANDEHLEGARP